MSFLSERTALFPLPFLVGLAVAGCTAPATSGAAGDAELSALTDHGHTVPVANALPTQWTGNGSTACRNHQNEDPTITKFRYDANTWILRENKCLNYEGNFIHVLFGHDKVLIQDTGSIPEGMSQAEFTRLFPIRDTVEGIIAEWLAEQPAEGGQPRSRESIELLVTHTHSHGDHVQGDYQFVGKPHTTVVGKTPAQVALFFGITDWPARPSVLDLGGRKLDVLAIPGHEAAHVAIYDHGAELLFSGDSVYPGHIFIRDWNGYRASMQRLDAFLSETGPNGQLLRPVRHVLGTHIEKPPGARQFYRYGTSVHEPERKLELTREHVKLIANTMAAAAGPANILTDDISLEGAD